MFSQLQAGESQRAAGGDQVRRARLARGDRRRVSRSSAPRRSSVRILHGGVGAITESDVTLAQASQAVILGFNVRANAQARELAKREGVEIRYYSIIYELLDEMKGLLAGMLAPESRETILGHAEIREVFNVTKVGKIAGCRVVDGLIRRGARVRLLRDDVVIYDGELGSLKRFKDDVREVREGFECGMSIDGYNDIRAGRRDRGLRGDRRWRARSRRSRGFSAVGRHPAGGRLAWIGACRQRQSLCPRNDREGPSQRQLRVAEQVRHLLAEHLMRGDLHDRHLETARVTVSEVRMSRDLRHAQVFVTELGERGPAGDARLAGQGGAVPGGPAGARDESEIRAQAAFRAGYQLQLRRQDRQPAERGLEAASRGRC